MNVRIIDADALKTKCGEWYTEEGTEEGFIGTLGSLLDAAPTVPAIPVEWLWKAQDRMLNSPRYSLAECAIVGTLIKAWQREQEEGNK